MLRTLGLLACLVAGSGCKDCSKPKAKPAAETEVRGSGTGAAPRASGKLRELEAAMCACKDAACAERVADELAAWSKDTAMTEAMSRCMDAAMAGSAESSETGGGAVIAKMTEFKERMCACKDTACATKVSDDMTAWSKESEKANAETPMSQADAEKAAEIGAQIGKCMQSAVSEALDLTR